MAVARHVAFVPGTPFYANQPDARTLRLSFVTASVAQIHTGIAALAGAIREMSAELNALAVNTAWRLDALPQP